MSEETPQTEAEALGHLLASFDYDLALELLNAADLASQHHDTRNRLMRLIQIISIDFPALAVRWNDLTAEPAEPIEPIEPEGD